MEHVTDTAATKAVQCFLVLNHDAWPETLEELVDYGIEEVHYLLDHFQCVLERNGCDRALAKEEFQALKTLVFMSFKELPRAMGNPSDQGTLLLRFT